LNWYQIVLQQKSNTHSIVIMGKIVAVVNILEAGSFYKSLLHFKLSGYVCAIISTLL